LKKYRHILSIYLLLFFLNTSAQNPLMDSLQLALKKSVHDTDRCKILDDMIESEQSDELWPQYNLQMEKICDKQLERKDLSKQELLFYRRVKNHTVSNNSLFLVTKGEMKEALIGFEKCLEFETEMNDIAGKSGTLYNMGSIYYRTGEVKKAAACFEESILLQEKNKLDNGLSQSYSDLGIIFMESGNSGKAIFLYKKAIEHATAQNNKIEMANGYNNIGSCYLSLGNISLALEYFQKALQLREEIGDIAGIANAMNNFGAVYHSQHDFVNAQIYFEKALRFFSDAKDEAGMAHSYNNIGTVFADNNDDLKAISYFEKSLSLRKAIGDKRGQCYALTSIGTSRTDLKEFDKAIVNFTESLKLAEELDDKNSIVSNYSSLAMNYFSQHKNKEAVDCGTRALKLAQQYKYPILIREVSLVLHQIYEGTGDFMSAFKMYELHIRTTDSLRNEDNKKATIRSQLKHEYDTKAAADSVAHVQDNEIKSAEFTRQSAEISAKKNQQRTMIGGLILVLLFSAFMYNRNKVAQRQKKMIEDQTLHVEQQKKLVELKQKEILDSIKYAKRIQTAHLPSESFIARTILKFRK
jgi:tetratricopeptide (TPR) repeat protein